MSGNDWFVAGTGWQLGGGIIDEWRVIVLW